MLTAGDWCIEYLPFHSARQVQTAVGRSLLPSGTDLEQELFRGVHRQHAGVDAVQGDGAQITYHGLLQEIVTSFCFYPNVACCIQVQTVCQPLLLL